MKVDVNKTGWMRRGKLAEKLEVSGSWIAKAAQGPCVVAGRYFVYRKDDGYFYKYRAIEIPEEDFWEWINGEGIDAYARWLGVTYHRLTALIRNGFQSDFKALLKERLEI